MLYESVLSTSDLYRYLFGTYDAVMENIYAKINAFTKIEADRTLWRSTSLIWTPWIGGQFERWIVLQTKRV